MRHKGKIDFYVKDYWNIVLSQNRKCALTGRTLEAINSELELKNPNLKNDEGKFDKVNFYIVDRAVSFLAKYLSEYEIIALALEIIKYRKPRSIRNERIERKITVSKSLGRKKT